VWTCSGSSDRARTVSSEPVGREAELKAADEELAKAIEKHARITGLEGVMTEWVVVVGSQGYDDDSHFSQVGTFTPDAMPYYRVMGLLDYALTRCRSKIGKWINDADD